MSFLDQIPWQLFALAIVAALWVISRQLSRIEDRLDRFADRLRDDDK